MEKLRRPTPSPGRLPERATPSCERESSVATVGAGYQHIGAKSPGRHVTVTSAGLRHIGEGVVLVTFPNVCVIGFICVYVLGYSLR